jgi:HEAT repeat protein
METEIGRLPANATPVREPKPEIAEATKAQTTGSLDERVWQPEKELVQEMEPPVNESDYTSFSLDQVPLMSPDELLSWVNSLNGDDRAAGEVNQRTETEDEAPARHMQLPPVNVRNETNDTPVPEAFDEVEPLLDLPSIPLTEEPSGVAELPELSLDGESDSSADVLDILETPDLSTWEREEGSVVLNQQEKDIVLAEDFLESSYPEAARLQSEDSTQRAAAILHIGRSHGEVAFQDVCAAFDDPAQEVRNAAAHALYELNPDRAGSFTRALREGSFERRRRIGNALASSGLAAKSISHLSGEGREKTYDAFSLLFLMSKAGEVQPLVRAVEDHPNSDVRLAVVKVLALSGQQEILPYLRRLAVRGSLPTNVRSAVMEAIYQISNQVGADTHTAA